jgi:hypothetical protein
MSSRVEARRAKRDLLKIAVMAVIGAALVLVLNINRPGAGQ